MSDLIAEAANVLLPLAAMGAGASVQALATEAGKDLHALSQSLLARLRRRDATSVESAEGSESDLEGLTESLSEATADGTISTPELERLVALAREVVPHSGPTVTAAAMRNVFVSNTFTGTVNIA